MSNAVQQEVVKDIITSALFGEKDMKESIEQLSEILFPGEDLIELIRRQKVINEVGTKVEIFNEKNDVELVHIEKVENGSFNVTLSFAKVTEFIAEHQKVAAHLTQVARNYGVKFNVNFMLSQNIE